MRLTLVSLFILSGCASSRAAMPSLTPYALSALPGPAAVLEENHFSRDRMGVGEPELRQILAAPVFLEEHARIGVLPVATGYAPEGYVWALGGLWLLQVAGLSWLWSGRRLFQP